MYHVIVYAVYHHVLIPIVNQYSNTNWKNLFDGGLFIYIQGIIVVFTRPRKR
jgi:hypothetical protein